MGFVSLKVYDILGNEVAELVNEEQSPGTYEVEFSVDSSPVSRIKYLASGIYFYRRHIGDQVLTNKMILLR